MTKACDSHPDLDDNPCIACGACCASFRVSFYCGEVSGGSSGVVPAELVSPINPVMVCMKGTERGHQRCIALEGTLGQPGIHCRIYAQRPSTCRDFNHWEADGTPNPECQRLRAGLGLAPLPAHPPQVA